MPLPQLVSLDEALSVIKSGSIVVTAMAAAEPQALFERLGCHCAGLRDVVVHCANPSRDYECFTRNDLLGRLELRVMFLTSRVRQLQGHGRVHYVPQHLSQWVRNLTRRGTVDVFWGSCSTPDARGFVSLGPGACYEPEVLRSARVVVLEMNPNIPVTSGATHVPLSWVTHLVASEATLPALERAAPDAIDRRIAAHIAGLVPDGSTIQLGIGGIPNAVGEALRSRRDLGIHTEMINDSMMDLYLAGAVTGRRKTIWPGKIVGSFVYGTRALYDFVHSNPAVELQPASVVNDPVRIGRNYRMVSINTAVEVDITGQVCSESIGHSELSGVGGATDTHVGAQRSEGGRGIVALRASTKDGKGSKIVFELKPGAKVSISRNDVDTVVTEHGIAELAGKTVAERARALIAVAAPEFRERLLADAREVGYV
jgi:acyl-CoA hydrolase